MTLELLPAVDLLGGQAIRLVQGELGTETGYGDPVDAAEAFAAGGARWLHVVDLDAAFGRGPVNRDHVGRVVEAVAPVRVEASGGVRATADLHALLDLGAARVVIGTAALTDPAWVAEACARHGDAVAVGLDARGRTLQARGWTESGGDLFETLRRLDAVGSLEAVLAATDRPVVASGGVAVLDDLAALAGLEPLGLEGVIVGKALYAGRFTVAEALALLAGTWPAGAHDPGGRDPEAARAAGAPMTRVGATRRPRGRRGRP